MGFGNLTKSLKKIKIDRTIYQQISVYISVRNKKNLEATLFTDLV